MFIQPTKKVVKIIEANKDEVVVKIEEEDEVMDKDKVMRKAQQISKRGNSFVRENRLHILKAIACFSILNEIFWIML